ncbi:uncharacterized protein BXZ73DRAFT_108193 [Epithele typhae]|uniref:uncharacterized protein n=1 Tax=Epithele typhae TaxID=378194 RepID=UPI002008EA7A|nr:uncharacterized protein BXZ73DRAFT_108193 [Epithele typhae]KAH9911180.1 hypothetical protein BXZ73DRAFT_108193 [Epithele typhae]
MPGPELKLPLVLLIAHNGPAAHHGLGSAPLPLPLSPSDCSIYLFHQNHYVDPSPSPSPSPSLTLTLATLLTALHPHLHTPITVDYYNTTPSHSVRRQCILLESSR